MSSYHLRPTDDIITYEELKRGFMLGKVRLVANREAKGELVCIIEDNWFYFQNADPSDTYMSPMQCIENQGGADAVLEQLIRYLNTECREQFGDEFAYYKAVLSSDAHVGAPESLGTARSTATL